jgi:hypothetical protein
MNETTDRWRHYQIGKKDHRLWVVHRDKIYEVALTGRSTSHGKVHGKSNQLLDNDEIPNISSTFMEFVNELADWDRDLLKSRHRCTNA